MKNKETVRDFWGRILGYIETDNNGNKTVRDFWGRILGYYNRSLNVTQDFYKRVIARGDQASSLIGLNKGKNL